MNRTNGIKKIEQKELKKPPSRSSGLQVSFVK